MISICMKDKEYEYRLIRALTLRGYKLGDKSQGTVKLPSITDFEDEGSDSRYSIVFSDLRIEGKIFKYQPIENICRELDLHLRRIEDEEGPRIILFSNLNELKRENSQVKPLIEELQKHGKTLLLNLNNFMLPDFNNNLYHSLDDLFLLDNGAGEKTDFQVNESQSGDFLYSSCYPFELNLGGLYSLQGLRDNLQKLKYKFIVLDYNFILSQNSMAILEMADLHIFIFNGGLDNIYIERLINFLEKNRFIAKESGVFSFNSDKRENSYESLNKVNWRVYLEKNGIIRPD